ncbi:MAG: type II toxin-antitoxin system RelE/ParE family toxin [Verrucomicrobiaceae bacterium]|jgi:plasmid stabilization system protein ParE|nr:type II toxin-antitoxin system RelE/ParE family toxin [Verrucomicrobiaceae bacterium]
MRAPVVILAGAELDVQRIYNRLTDYRDGAGDEFMDRLAGVFKQLEMFPELGPIRQFGFRRILVPGHIYGVFYQVEERGVMVHAVADLRQDPAWLEKTLRERLE